MSFRVEFRVNPWVERLGYSPQQRLVIFHADDVGMCHGSNRAFLDLAEAGVVKTGSVMLPCAWSPEILRIAAADPSLDLGVHLTLTSEWNAYRWGPLSTRDPASGLLDEEGYFWHRTHQVRAALQPAAAQKELRAQIDRARAFGLDFTHLDAHMGAALLPELFDFYLDLGEECAVPLLMLRDAELYRRVLGVADPDSDEWARRVRRVELSGIPLFDHFCITPDHHPDGRDADRATLYEAILRDLPPGSLTFFSLHPCAPGEIETLTPERAYWRTFEYDYFRSSRLLEFLEQEQIQPIGFREICNVLSQDKLPMTVLPMTEEER